LFHHKDLFYGVAAFSPLKKSRNAHSETTWKWTVQDTQVIASAVQRCSVTQSRSPRPLGDLPHKWTLHLHLRLAKGLADLRWQFAKVRSRLAVGFVAAVAKLHKTHNMHKCMIH
jgi:hypothetical protein